MPPPCQAQVARPDYDHGHDRYLLVVVIIRMFDDDNRNDEDGLHVKVGKKSRPSLFVLEDELGPVITASFSISWNLEF